MVPLTIVVATEVTEVVTAVITEAAEATIEAVVEVTTIKKVAKAVAMLFSEIKQAMKIDEEEEVVLTVAVETMVTERDMRAAKMSMKSVM